MTPSFAVKRGIRYRYYVSRAVTEGRNDLAGSMTRVPAVDVEEAVVKALRQLASTVDPKRWSRLTGPPPREAKRLIECSAIVLRDGAIPTNLSMPETASIAPYGAPRSPTTARLSIESRPAATPAPCQMTSVPSSPMASEDRRLIEVVVERVAIQDGSIEIALTREAAAIVGQS